MKWFAVKGLGFRALGTVMAVDFACWMFGEPCVDVFCSIRVHATCEEVTAGLLSLGVEFMPERWGLNPIDDFSVARFSRHGT